jgi:hypothetical protein
VAGPARRWSASLARHGRCGPGASSSQGSSRRSRATSVGSRMLPGAETPPPPAALFPHKTQTRRVPAARRLEGAHHVDHRAEGRHELNPRPMAQTSPSTLPLATTAGRSPSTALPTRGRWRRPLVVCGTGGRQFRSMALRGPHRSVVGVATLPAMALTTGWWWW